MTKVIFSKNVGAVSDSENGPSLMFFMNDFGLENQALSLPSSFAVPK
jgi:hypothetical protein